MTFTEWFIFFLIIQVVHFLGTWKLYQRAGRKAWEAAIPVYNAIVLMQIINRPKWWVILFFIPIVNLIIIPVTWVETIRSFGRNSTAETFAVILTFGLYIYYVNYATNDPYIVDRDLKPRSEAGEWISSVLFAVIAATIVHTYFLQPFTIPTSSLEKTLLVGDFLLVSKFHYGARVPKTAVAFPMVHDTIPVLGVKSYLNDPQIPYLRFPGFEKVERNDIVVFNWPVDTVNAFQQYGDGKYYKKPIDKKSNYVKRAVGVPGDSLSVKNGYVFIGGKQLELPERAKPQFKYTGVTKGQPFNPQTLYKVYDITDGFGYNPTTNEFTFIALTEDAYERLKNHPNVASIQRAEDTLSRSTRLYPNDRKARWNNDNMGPIYIPEAGKTVELTSESMPFYKEIIETYEGSEFGLNNKLSLNGTQVLLNGQPVESYTFKQNYYWMMGDNRNNSEDSRTWGLVPENHIVGKPVFVWLSWDSNASGFDKIRWNRVFTTVKGDGEPTSFLPYFLIVVVIFFGWRFFKKRRDA